MISDLELKKLYQENRGKDDPPLQSGSVVRQHGARGSYISIFKFNHSGTAEYGGDFATAVGCFLDDNDDNIFVITSSGHGGVFSRLVTREGIDSALASLERAIRSGQKEDIFDPVFEEYIHLVSAIVEYSRYKIISTIILQCGQSRR